MRRVEVTAYNPDWPALYAAEAGVLAGLLGEELVRTHHIGSTSVPELRAKPIIDILAEVRDVERLDSLDGRMAAAGYTPMGEYGICGRRYYFKGTPELHTHHLHAFTEGHPEIRRHLLFRDYLREHPDAAREYAALKDSLAARFPTDIEAYVAGKDAFIRELDRRAAQWAGGKR